MVLRVSRRAGVRNGKASLARFQRCFRLRALLRCLHRVRSPFCTVSKLVWMKVFKLSIIVRIQVAKFDRQRAERDYGASLIWKELKLEGV